MSKERKVKRIESTFYCKNIDSILAYGEKLKQERGVDTVPISEVLEAIPMQFGQKDTVIYEDD